MSRLYCLCLTQGSLKGESVLAAIYGVELLFPTDFVRS